MTAIGKCISPDISYCDGKVEPIFLNTLTEDDNPLRIDMQCYDPKSLKVALRHNNKLPHNRQIYPLNAEGLPIICGGEASPIRHRMSSPLERQIRMNGTSYTYDGIDYIRFQNYLYTIQDVVSGDNNLYPIGDIRNNEPHFYHDEEPTIESLEEESRLRAQFGLEGGKRKRKKTRTRRRKSKKKTRKRKKRKRKRTKRTRNRKIK